MARSLEERLNTEPAKGWKPDPGDQIIGEIVSISIAPGTDWGPYPLIEIDPDTGDPVAVHAFHSVLKNEIERLAPVEGDRIGIKYLGKRQGAKQEYEAYTVALERATPRAATSSTPAPAPVVPVGPSLIDDVDDQEPF